MSLNKQKKPVAKKPVFQLKLWHYLAIVVLPLLIFGRSAWFGYVMHDDDKMIPDNPMIEQGLDPAIAFTTDAWFMDARIELYRPWQSITYMIDYTIGKEDPMVYHIHNLLAFIVGAFLLFVFLRQYFKPLLAWAGTLLYSVNLLTPHAVGWLAARGDLYLMIFGLAFLILVNKHLKSGSSGPLWMSVPMFFLALLSKESAVALIPVAFVLLYAQRSKLPSGIQWAWIGTLLVAFVAYYMMRQPAIAEAENFSAQAFVSNLRSLPEEFFKMLVPLGFSVMPGYNIIWTLAGTVLLGVLFFFYKKYPQDRSVWMPGLTIILASLLPSMLYEPSFAKVSYDYLDHRTWFPFVGLWLIVLGIVDKAKFTTNNVATYIFAGLLIAWSGINAWRIGTYKNWQNYYQNAIASNPGSSLANLNYGSMLRDEGKWEEALIYTQKAVDLGPEFTDAKVRLAEVYFNLQKYPETVEIASRALEKEPNNVSALQFRGSALGASGRSAEAIVDFQKILELDPNNDHGMFNLGMAYKDANRLNEAIEVLSKLLVKNPSFPNAYYERGFCYGRMGLFPQAKQDMDNSIGLQPAHGPSYFFRGRAMEALGDLASACQDWKKALELGTKDAEPFVMQKCN